MIILRDGELAQQLQLLKAFGVDRTHGERKVSGVYDTVALGFNYRMSEIKRQLVFNKSKSCLIFFINACIILRL